MKIIVVADKQASRFLNNKSNLGFNSEDFALYGNIMKGVKGVERVWDGDRWVNGPTHLVVHNQQITKRYEIQRIVSALLIGGYETAIIGCNPTTTAVHLTHRLREVFGYENVTVIYPNLNQGFEQYKSLRDIIRNQLNLPTTKKIDATTSGAVNPRGKIIVVSDEKASTFLSDHINLGETPEHFVLSGDIIKGNYAQGRIAWNGERWEDVPPALVVHNRQVNNKNQVEPLIAGLIEAGHDNVIIGCDPDIAESHLMPGLKDFFTDDNIHLLSSALEEGRSETLRLREYVQEILYPTTVEKGSVVSEEGVSKSGPQRETRHLRVTLTNSSDPKSTPSVIDVFFKDGDHLKLDFRDTNQETSWKSL